MGDAKAAADYLRSLGYSVTWEENGSTTMQMPDGSTREIPNYRAVVTDAAGNAAESRKTGGGGGGGGGGDWENPYDKLYNVTEKINQAMREREKIERRYERMIERRQATAAELYKASQEEIENLREQAELQKKMINGRKDMIQEELDENKDLQKYATIDKETGEITINWDLINSVKSEEKGKEIEEYIAKLEELRDSMHDAEDALEDINDAIWEIEQRGREEYLEFEDKIKDAVIAAREAEIETLEKINDSINDTNAELLDAV
jgi:DNA repair exonuclease SbcCD ATPase subunit